MRKLQSINVSLWEYPNESKLDEDLSDLGMDSITFIKIIVAAEKEFECEIPDSKLLIGEMNTANKIVRVLQNIEATT